MGRGVMGSAEGVETLWGLRRGGWSGAGFAAVAAGDPEG